MTRYIDLFAGIGGFRLGLTEAPIPTTCVFTSEIDGDARRCYADNFGLDEASIAGDITGIDAADIPDHDLLVGGFPCQAFSRAGSRRGFDDIRGTLFFDIVRILEHHETPAFILENVRGLLDHDEGRTFRTIVRELQRLEYYLSWQIIPAAGWLPQIRKRVFIVGHRSRPEFGIDFMQIRPSCGGPTLGSILEDDPDDRFTLTDSEWSKIKEYSERHSSKPGSTGFKHRVYQSDEVGSALVASYGQLKPAGCILIENGEGNPRRLTIREAARYMGFPDDFRLPDEMKVAYRLLGNAVCPPVVRSLADYLLWDTCPLRKRVG